MNKVKCLKAIGGTGSLTAGEFYESAKVGHPFFDLMSIRIKDNFGKWVIGHKKFFEVQ